MMWRAINHKQLKELYEINKDTKEIRSKSYKVFKNGELESANSTHIIEWEDKDLVYLFHQQRRDWFRVDRLYRKTFL